MAHWFDNFIGFFSPTAKVRRMKARHIANLFEDYAKTTRKYEGGSKGRRTENWKTSNKDANAEIGADLPTLRNRSRDLIRNDGYAKRAQSIVTNNTVGWGIVPQIALESDQPRRKKQIEELWNSWAQSTSLDADGRHNFYSMQSLWMDSVFESGEVLVRKVVEKDPRLPIPGKLQLLEPDFLDTSLQSQRVQLGNGNYVLQGIEFNKKGERVGYWLFPQHPGATLLPIQQSIVSKRVDVSEILHGFRPSRPGQIRGVPWLDACMLRLRDYGDYEQAQLIRQKIACCLTAFVIDSAEPTTEVERDYIFGEKMEPGLVEILPPGRDIRFNNPPGTENYEEYQRAMLRAIAVSIGLTYEQLAGDLSNVNFSSARMGWLEFQRNVEAWRWQLIIPQFLDPVWQWFVQLAELSGVKMDGVSVSWSCPRREMIDPSKELSATKEGIRAGLISWQEAVRQSGYEPNKVLDEIEAANKLFDEKKITLDIDPRKVNASGAVQGNMNNAGGNSNDQNNQ